MQRTIKGITGFARSGKDTVGNELARQLGYKTYSLATPMKEFTHKLLNWEEPQSYEDMKHVPQLVRVTKGSISAAREVATAYGLDEYIKASRGIFDMYALFNIAGINRAMYFEIYRTPREMYQLIGTEWARNYINKDIWANLMPYEGHVITDIRFDNEAEILKARGGDIIRVTRYNVGKELGGVEGHESEQGVTDSLVDIDFLNNTNTKKGLADSVEVLCLSLNKFDKSFV